MRRILSALVAIFYTTAALAGGASGPTTTAVTQPIPDYSNLIATDAFVFNADVRSLATFPLNFGSNGGGTYSFNGQGSGASLVVGVTGGAITSILTVATPGTGYAAGDVIALTSGNNDNLLRVLTVSSGGIATAEILYGGTGNTNGFHASPAAISPAIARNFTISGTLTSNVQIIAIGGTYITASAFYSVSNNTTGPYTFNICQAANATTDSCSGGRTVNIPQGTSNSANTVIQTDGVGNIDILSGNIHANVLVATGTSPTGTTGSCSASSFVGGALAGKFSAAVCAGGTFILSELPTAPNGYACDAEDQTTPADTLKQTANSTTSVTFTSTTAASDVVVFKCLAF